MTRLPPVADEVVVADFDTEFVVLVPTRRRVYHLDTARALVFDSCVRRDDRETLTADLVGATGGDANTLRKWIVDAIADLQESGILGETTPNLRGIISDDDSAIFSSSDHSGRNGRKP